LTKSPIKSLCVYCGSRAGDDDIYAETAKKLGESLAETGTRLVYGGGKLGLMGITAGTVRDLGGDVFGVIPKFLVSVEGVLEGVDHIEVDSMHERKMRMFEESDAFCVLPGGIGTLEEIIELLSWVRLDLHRKPLILCNVKGYWDPLVKLLHHVVDEGFAAKELKEDLIVVSSPEEVMPAACERMLCARA